MWTALGGVGPIHPNIDQMTLQTAPPAAPAAAPIPGAPPMAPPTAPPAAPATAPTPALLATWAPRPWSGVAPAWSASALHAAMSWSAVAFPTCWYFWLLYRIGRAVAQPTIPIMRRARNRNFIRRPWRDCVRKSKPPGREVRIAPPPAALWRSHEQFDYLADNGRPRCPGHDRSGPPASQGDDEP